ncbi:hypothetical protein P2H44_22735 [Albimonas sp. CAU 1670]|uniref:hypothetical protein n=1 Tax=Albimonas sp. CAU 1670 TaxID=3032599 RepID=UPI0023DBED4B|nr:hypothetical protein [Albimonas sp. CAU 1670]MDF2235382.1 hypothetical protein [Albimonas sp. CAU 1670]
MRAPLTGRPWRDLSLTPLTCGPALRVLQELDPQDRREAGCALNGDASPDFLLREFLRRQGEGGHVFVAWSHRPEGGADPFAILGVAAIIASGVGSAALLARRHDRWRPQLRALAFALRVDLPPWARLQGFHRLEARSWSDHPTAGTLLGAIGFRHELRLVGFAAGGADFDLYALSTRPSPGA